MSDLLIRNHNLVMARIDALLGNRPQIIPEAEWERQVQELAELLEARLDVLK